MRVLGIISEYNPFHNGHLYQLERSKTIVNPDYSIAIMSGNFTQRGEIALLSKWDRAAMAVSCGVDLIIELPFVFACNNAEYFAKGAIEILNRLGIVTHLSFGSESGSLEALNLLADIFANENNEFKSELKKNLKAGFSYPRSRALSAIKMLKASTNISEIEALLSSPNNILGIEYLKQLKLSRSIIEPLTIQRAGAHHKDLNIPKLLSIDKNLKATFASAGSIRHLVKNFENMAQGTPIKQDLLKDFEDSLSTFLPTPSKSKIMSLLTYNLCHGIQAQDSESLMFNLVLYKILSSSLSELSEIFSVTEGLEHKLKSSVPLASSLNSLKTLISSKRYTETRINRILIHTLMDIKREKLFKIIAEEQYYARLLAFNSKGAELIKIIKKSNTLSIPLITNLNKDRKNIADFAPLTLHYDTLSSDIYNMLRSNDMYKFSDMCCHPSFINFND